ncbi:MAG: hypothetical protein ACREHD_23365 [Pirellulales bacterium]
MNAQIVSRGAIRQEYVPALLVLVDSDDEFSGTSRQFDRLAQHATIGP